MPHGWPVIETENGYDVNVRADLVDGKVVITSDSEDWIIVDDETPVSLVTRHYDPESHEPIEERITPEEAERDYRTWCERLERNRIARVQCWEAERPERVARFTEHEAAVLALAEQAGLTLEDNGAPVGDGEEPGGSAFVRSISVATPTSLLRAESATSGRRDGEGAARTDARLQGQGRLYVTLANPALR